MTNLESLDALLDWLYARINYERQSKATMDSFRLQTMRCLAQRLENPHLQYPIIHVAGTKGKGSVSAMIGQILIESGLKTGVYVSPHLESINQRILLNGEPIDDATLRQVLQDLKPVVNQIDEEASSSDLLRPLTFFEIITAAAMVYFSQQQVDVAVLEVGMGGRLDSTNICTPTLSVISSISFDHMQQLGNTLAEIAFEKAGIIKPGVPIVSGVPPRETEAATVIESVAAERGATLRQLERDFSVTPSSSSSGFDFVSLGEPLTRLDDLKLSMLGAHQTSNAALAISACLELKQQGWKISEAHLRQGLLRANLAGRTEVVQSQPTVILDIAHNPASIAALVDTLNQWKPFQLSRRRILIIAISKDKDAATMLAHILPHFDCVICTAFVCNPRAIAPQELLDLAERISPAPERGSQSSALSKYHQCCTSFEALTLAQSQATENDLICIAGSVFLVADLRLRVIAPLSITPVQRI